MILIVEDDLSEQFILSQLVCSFDYSTKAVSSAEDALMQLSLFEFRAVIMNVNLPGMSGIDCVREIKKSKASSVPVIGITGSARTDDPSRQEGLKAGIADYLVKPFDREQLRRLLLRHIYDTERINLKMLKMPDPDTN